MKIWAKLMIEDRMIKDLIYEDSLTLTPNNYQKAIQEIAYKLDIATPISISSHYKHFERFNRIVYLPRDFIESVDFTSFVMERIIENKNKPQNIYI